VGITASGSLAKRDKTRRGGGSETESGAVRPCRFHAAIDAHGNEDAGAEADADDQSLTPVPELLGPTTPTGVGVRGPDPD
jgi:hypothetical protein